jgi:hypothetical protein
MLENRGALAVTLALVATASRDGHAAAGTAFAETSRVASLADAVTARPGDASTILLNPAGLADLKEGMIVVGGQGDYLSQWFQPTGAPSQDRSRGFGAFSFCAATPLPGPPWARAISVGMALDIPAQYLLNINIPVRLDQPVSPMYDGPPDRLATVFGVGFKVLPRVEVGAGFALAPSLTLPTNVQYVAGRSQNVNDNVEVRLDDSLDLAAAPFVGLRAQPFDWLGLSVVYRDIQASHATAQQMTTAGGIVSAETIDFFEMWDPASLVFGAYVAVSKRLSLSLDVAWHKWSDFRTGFDQTLCVGAACPPNSVSALPFNDTVSVASGVEMTLPRGLAVRGGIGVEPSPIPAQTGETNYLGGNTLVLALGAGLDFRRFDHLPFIIDAHVRARLDAPESATKNASALPDADPTLPGQQIDNLGYPGFRSQTFMLQAGLSATFFLGGGVATRGVR